MIAGTMPGDDNGSATTEPAKAATPAPAATTPTDAPPAPATATPSPATPAQPVAKTPDAAKPGDKPADPAPAAPAGEAKYDLKPADGTDPKVVEATVALAKQHKLSPEAAQAVLDRETAVRKEIADAHQATISALPEQWQEQSKQAFGAKLDEELGHAKRVLERFGRQELRDALNQTGLGNHPELVRLLGAIGRSMGDDAPAPTRPGVGDSAAPKSLASFY